METSRPGPRPSRVAFEERPCLCVRRHSPMALRVELHHVYPQSEQKKRYGRVVDKTVTPLCDNAHANVHIALTRIMKGEEYRLANRYLQGVVDAGMRMIKGGVDAG